MKFSIRRKRQRIQQCHSLVPLHAGTPDDESGVLMLKPFTRHPEAVGETYGQHMGVAWSFGFNLIGAGLACLVHGLLPFAFERTGSNTVRRLNERLGRRCALADKTRGLDAAPVQG